MSKKKMLIILVLVFVILIGGASLLYTQLSKGDMPEQLQVQEEQNSSAKENQNSNSNTNNEQQLTKATDFVVFDASGKAVKLSDYFGKPIVLNFWASWCGPCRGEMPDFHQKYLELGDEVSFLMVNMTRGRETLSSAKEFISENGYTFPVFFDTETHAARTYSVYSYPTTYFINAEGYIVTKATGSISADALQRGIDMIK